MAVIPTIKHISNKERENNIKETESIGLIITDPKRRMVESPLIHEALTDLTEEDEVIPDTQIQVYDNQKNEVVAGSAKQTRQEL